jgi:hypothetical protein
MSLDKNYSTINKQTKVFDIDDTNYNTSRVIVNIKESEYVSGITTGSVIRFDTVANQYNLSKADFPENAEVFGIVESMNSDLSLNVVINGSITIHSNRLVNISGTNSGLNDIYFLSGTSYGWLQNCGPTFTGMVIKPIYQVSPHGEYTGLVRNYLGYINPILVNNAAQSVQLLSAISQDLTKALFYVADSDTFIIKSLTYLPASNIFRTTRISEITKSSIVIEPGLDVVDFGTSSNYEAKISNDGNDLLLFAKNTNKIYSININGSIFTLKAIINVNLPGSPEDKLWAADDELTSMVVSTKGLNKFSSDNDCRHMSPSVSSPIKYYRRSVNNLSGFKHRWIRTHERPAIGFIRDSRSPTTDIGIRDSIITTPGIFRTSDIKCTGKNYTLSTFGLSSDQINYKSRENTFLLPRYSGIQNPGSISSGLNLISIQGDVKTTITNSYSDYFIFNYNIQNRLYDIEHCFYNFNIHKKINNYYTEDYSYKTVYGFVPNISKLGIGGSYAIFEGSILYTSTTYGAIVNPPIPSVIKETLCSRTYSTDTIAVSGVLHNFYNDNTKKLLVYKLPFYTNDGYTPLRYFESSTVGSQIIPSQTGFGQIKYFTSADIADINNLSFFNLFGNDSIFFICTPSYVIVFTFATSSFVRINTSEDFSKAIFYSNANGEFFILNKKIFKYNSSSQQISEIGIL